MTCRNNPTVSASRAAPRRAGTSPAVCAPAATGAFYSRAVTGASRGVSGSSGGLGHSTQTQIGARAAKSGIHPQSGIARQPHETGRTNSHGGGFISSARVSDGGAERREDAPASKEGKV